MRSILSTSAIRSFVWVAFLLAAITVYGAEQAPQTVGWSTLKLLTSSTPANSPVRQLEGKRVDVRLGRQGSDGVKLPASEDRVP